MLQRYPSTIRWRQALPPLFVLSLAGSTVLSFWFVPALFFLIAEMSIYLAILFLAGIIAAFTSPLTPDPVPLAVHGEEAAARPRREMGLIAGLPLAILTMHLAWGGGFLWSMISGFAKK